MVEIEVGVGPAASTPMDVRYAWVLTRLREVFGADAVWHKEFDWGTAYAVAVRSAGRRYARKLEYSWITNPEAGERVWDEDDQEWRVVPPPGGWTYDHYALADDPQARVKIEQWIKRVQRGEGP